MNKSVTKLWVTIKIIRKNVFGLYIRFAVVAYVDAIDGASNRKAPGQYEPEALITWFKDGNLLIHDSDLFIISAVVGRGNKSNSVVYHCRTHNEFGETLSRNASLLITCKFFLFSLFQVLNVGDTLCEIRRRRRVHMCGQQPAWAADYAG